MVEHPGRLDRVDRLEWQEVQLVGQGDQHVGKVEQLLADQADETL